MLHPKFPFIQNVLFTQEKREVALRGGLQRNQGGSFAASLCLFFLAEEKLPALDGAAGKVGNNCLPTKSRWLFESKYIEHAVVAQVP